METKDVFWGLDEIEFQVYQICSLEFDRCGLKFLKENLCIYIIGYCCSINSVCHCSVVSIDIHGSQIGIFALNRGEFFTH